MNTIAPITVEAFRILLEVLNPEERTELLNEVAEGFCILVMGCGTGDPKDCTCSTDYQE